MFMSGDCAPSLMIPMNANSSTPSAASATFLKTAANSSQTRAWSLAARLTAWYTGAAFVLILATSGFLYWALITTLEREDDQYLFDKVRVVLATLRDEPGNERELRAEVKRTSEPGATGQLFVRVIGPNEQIAAETAGMCDH